jgi:hypothetical protein
MLMVEDMVLDGCGQGVGGRMGVAAQCGTAGYDNVTAGFSGSEKRLTASAAG